MRTQMCLWGSRLGHGGERRGQSEKIHSKVEHISRIQQGNNSISTHKCFPALDHVCPWTFSDHSLQN
jgi:hypothetical protein